MVDKTKDNKSKIFEDIRKIQIIVGALGAALLVAYFNLNTKINQLSSDNIDNFISELNNNNTKIQFYENEVSKLKKSLDMTNNNFDSLSKQMTSTKVGLVDRYDSLIVAYKEMAAIEKEKLLYNDIDSEKGRYKSNWRKLKYGMLPYQVVAAVGEPNSTELDGSALYYYYHNKEDVIDKYGSIDKKRSSFAGTVKFRIQSYDVKVHTLDSFIEPKFD